MRLDLLVDATELRPRLHEDRLAAAAPAGRRLPGVGPDGAAVEIPQVAELPPGVAGRVFAPPGDGETAPAAPAASGGGDGDMVAAVGEQVHLGRRAIEVGHHADRTGLSVRDASGRSCLAGVGKDRDREFWDPLLKEKGRRLHRRVGHEPPLHRAVEEHGGEGQQAHALVVRHELPHGHAAREPRGTGVSAIGFGRVGPRLARADGHAAGRGVVDRLDEAARAHAPIRGDSLEVAAGGVRRDEERQGAGVGSDHDVVGKPPLQAQARHAEGAVLVVHLHVAGVVSRFGNAPGHATPACVADLTVDRRPAGLVEERACPRGHHEHRHQVFKHRAAPGEQRGRTVLSRQQPPQREPVILVELAAGNEHVTAKAGLRRKQIVVAGVDAMLGGVVADGEQPPRRIVEKTKVDVGKAP